MGQYVSYQSVPPSEAEMPHSITSQSLQREITVIARSREEIFTSQELCMEQPAQWGSRNLVKVWQVNKDFLNPAHIKILQCTPQVIVADPDGKAVYLFKRTDGTSVHKYHSIMTDLVVQGVAETPEGNVIMADRDRQEVTVYPVNKPYTRKMTWKWKFGNPGTVHYCHLYSMYLVLDKHTRMVNLYDCKLRRVRSFGHNILQDPTCITTDHLGRIFIVDNQNGNILVFNICGTFLYQFSTRGTGERLEAPRGMCMDPLGNLYLTDHYNNRISVYSADGRFQYHITSDHLKGPIALDLCHETGLLAVTSKYLGWSQLTLFKLCP